MIMAKKGLTEARLQLIEDEIINASIPYDYDTKEYPVEVIIDKYKKDQIFVPTYQRNYVWKTKHQSRFIESVFLGVPIMPFLVSVSGDDAELEIIDGSQRIRTLVKYCNDEIKLQGLDKLPSLNGTRFSDLPKSRQNKFLLRDFRFHVVTEKATSEVRADIFNRVNTSSNKLSPSETRKGVYQGAFYDFIIACSKNELFRKVCPISPSKVARGEYEEFVLRFFAYSDSYLTFKHDVAPFLDEYLRDNRDTFNADELSRRFTKVVEFADKYLSPYYFAKKAFGVTTPRVRFEALSVGIHLALKKNPQLEPTDLSWIDSDDFKELTTSDASNNPGRLRARVEYVRDQLLKNSK